ncbi:MAG: adenosylmethionine--8-amino-7-oxononanoate transaminase, partial [Candidatus Omnitrophota bacterium]
NHTLLTVEVLRARGVDIAGIIINNAGGIDLNDESVRTNPASIAELSRVPVLGIVPALSRRLRAGKGWAGVAGKNVDLDAILYAPRYNDDRRKVKALDKKYIWHPFAQMRDYMKEDNPVIEEARGNYLKDVDGKWYLDGVSSLWVNVHGHRNRVIDDAVRTQLNRVAHSTLLGLGNRPAAELAGELIGIAPRGLTKVFYSDSGSTAVEIALKMAFQYWQQQPSPAARAKKRFVSFVNAYHGDTIGSVSVGGMDLFHKIYRPLLFKTIPAKYPYCYRCYRGSSYPQCGMACADDLEKTLQGRHHEIAALIVEPLVQAAAGMLVAPPGFLKRVRELCTRYDTLMIADEVAVGFGRTGKMFACEHEKVTPDLMTLAKGITGGYLPLAATLTTRRVFQGFCGEYAQQKTFFHGHTYTGNPLACRAALANLGLFRKKGYFAALEKKVRKLAAGLKRFDELEHVGEIRQRGMMVGIELVKSRDSKTPYDWKDKIGIQVIGHIRKAGIILRPLGNIIVLMPPLSVTEAEIQFILAETYRSIKEVTEIEN